MKVGKIIGRILCFLVFVFMMAPLVVVVITSFGTTRHVMFPPRGFTLAWFEKAVNNREFLESIILSLKLSTLSVAVSCVLGTMVSLYFWKSGDRFKNIWESIFLSPIVVPTVISAVALLQYFAIFGFISTFWRLALSYIAIEIPYVIRAVTASLSSLDASFEEASLVLGASPVKTLFRVTLPCVRGGIIAGAIFSFVVAFDEAVIVMFIRNSRTITYPLRLYSYITESFTPLISAFATIFIILSFLVIIVIEKTIGLNKMY